MPDDLPNPPPPLPVLPIELEYAPPSPADRRGAARVARALVVAWAVGTFAWALTFLAVRLVLLTGPLVLCAGGVLIFVALRMRATLPAAVGMVHCGFCLFLFGLVALLGWSPSEAGRPFQIMGGLYTLANTGLTMMAWARRPPVT